MIVDLSPILLLWVLLLVLLFERKPRAQRHTGEQAS